MGDLELEAITSVPGDMMLGDGGIYIQPANVIMKWGKVGWIVKNQGQCNPPGKQGTLAARSHCSHEASVLFKVSPPSMQISAGVVLGFALTAHKQK